MDKTILECKVYEFLSRLSIALKKGDVEAERKYLRQIVITERLQARNAVQDLVTAIRGLGEAERSMEKAKAAGILFPLGEKQIELLKEQVSEARKTLVGYGNSLCIFLDIWQGRGASLQDLCNLCNRDYAQVIQEIGPDRLGESFSGLMFVYHLDYKDPRNRGWIDFDVDAPLTHAAKEYWLDLMTSTPEARKASHEAFVKCFPEIWDKRVYTYTDPDGIQRVVDKDGVEVGTIGEEV